MTERLFFALLQPTVNHLLPKLLRSLQQFRKKTSFQRQRLLIIWAVFCNPTITYSVVLWQLIKRTISSCFHVMTRTLKVGDGECCHIEIQCHNNFYCSIDICCCIDRCIMRFIVTPISQHLQIRRELLPIFICSVFQFP